jgi:hypothetical protein
MELGPRDRLSQAFVHEVEKGRTTDTPYGPIVHLDLRHQVEVMELLPLSAYYVGRLPANPIFYDPRTAAGHVPLKGRICPQTFSWREIQEGIEKKQIGWKDVIDFYARHNCDEYTFWKGYHRWKAPGTLPSYAKASPPDGATKGEASP